MHPHLDRELLKRFLRQQMQRKILSVSISGAHAYGYGQPQGTIELKGIHVEATETILGLSKPSVMHNWVGEFEGHRVDYSSFEVGHALELLLRGEGSILESILAPHQLLETTDLPQLRKVAQGTISLRFVPYYLRLSKGVLKEFSALPRTIHHLLRAYRSGLTGAHLFQTGQIEIDLLQLADQHGLADIRALIARVEQDQGAMVEEGNPWVNRIAKLHGKIDRSVKGSSLPVDPPKPQAVEEYLLDLRRRYFDVPSISREII